ncbi:MAG TPA: hypothetical protein VFT04_03055 [Gemmatimonadales bacterium]|nr:hypothetical protein [Gemmatimonadales bacterium]
MRRAWVALLVTLIVVAGACGDDPAGPDDPPGGGPATALEIGPGAVLLTDAGATQQLTAFTVDASGGRIPVAATFRSSRPGTVSVSDRGLLTAVASLGSSLIVAEAEGVTSPPILVLVAQPAVGAVLVRDDQVDGLPVPVDPAAEYVVGWQERVRLVGVSPAVGQIVLGTGGLPIGGRVASVSDLGGGRAEIVYQLVPISELFTAIAVDESIPLANAVTVEGAPFGPSQSGGGSLRLAPAEAGQPETKFSLPRRGGPIECEAKFEGTLAPVELDLFSFDINPELSGDLVVTIQGIQRLVVRGTLAPRISVNPVLKAGMKGSFECKALLKTIILPIGGPVSRFVGGQIPLGVGFAVEATTQIGDFGYDAFFDGSASLALGFDCSAGCEAVAEATVAGGGSFKPILPPNLDELKSELTASFFGWAELALGSPLARELQFSTLEAKVGLQQKAKLATERVQALDASYKSDFQLAPAVEAGTTSKVTALAGLLNVQLASLKFEPDLPALAQSPAGTLTISPSTVAPGSAQALGETATFTVTLDPVTYLGIDAVDQVEIRWLRPDGSGGVTLEPGRPGCTAITPSTGGQTTFTCTTDFLEAHAGEQTFFAFVKPKLFGLSLPIGLEIDSAKVTVGGSPFTTSEVADVVGQAQGFDQADFCHEVIQPPPAPLPVPASASTSRNCNTSVTVFGVTGTADAALTASLTAGQPATGSSVRLTGGGTVSITFPPDANGEGRPVLGHASVDYVRLVSFTVPEGTSSSYSLTGSLTASGSGCATCPFASAHATLQSGGSTDIHDLEARHDGTPSLAVNNNGILPAGSYTLSVGVEILALDRESGTQSAAGSYDITFTLTPVMSP